MNAAYLWAQLEEADKINDKRLSIWNFYHEELKELEDKGVLELSLIHICRGLYAQDSLLQDQDSILSRGKLPVPDILQFPVSYNPPVRHLFYG